MKRYRNDSAYINEWIRVNSEYTGNPKTPPLPGRHLARANGGMPDCQYCWDTGLCPECYGRHMQYCPVTCGDGTCSCRAGQARRDAYSQSFIDFGLR